MPKTKISEFSATPANNTDIDSINIAEGCAPSGINDAIRELMSQLKDFQTGAVGDSFNGPVGTTTAAAGAFTTLSASSTVSGTGFSTYLASPPAIGGTAPAAGAFTTLSASGTLGVTGVATLGAGAILNTPASVTLTNATGLPISTGVSGLGTGVATFLATPSSANLIAAVTNETGTGSLVFATSPTLVTPLLGTPTSGVATNLTGLPLTTGVTGTLPTANGGTNLTSFTSGGVVYASSSSALATGSTLNFNGTSLAVGDSPSAADGSRFYVYGNIPASTQLGIKIAGNANAYTQQAIRFYDSYFDAYAGYIGFTTNSLTFGSGTTEGLRLTSSSLYTASGINVGFGTSSPAQRLDVNGNAQIGNATAGTNRYLYINGVANKAGAIAFQESGSTKWLVGNGAASENGNFELYEATSGNTLVMTRAGNLGLGVTPVNAYTGLAYKTIEVQKAAFFAFDVTGAQVVMGLKANAYYDSSANAKYIGNGFATQYQSTSGEHAWYTAPSNSSGAGAACTFTQAMTLDASGRLLIGMTSAVGIENVQSTGAISAGNQYNYFAQGNTTSNTCFALRTYSSSTASVVGSITFTGIATLYNTTSDQRLKENIVDAPDFGSVIDSIQVRSFDWKTDSTHQRAGFIAQELVTVAPEAVHQPTDSDEMMAVDYSKLVPMLVKEIQSLRQRLSAANL